MKAILFVVGTVGLVTSSAQADNAKANGGPKLASAAVVPPPPPELPADTRSALAPFPGLDKARPVVLAAKPAKPAKEKPIVMKFGADYVLGARKAATVTHEDVEEIKPRTLSRAQIATVVQSHMGELQTCWSALPAEQRADAVTAELALSIADTGTVLSIDVDADVPDTARMCISSAASHWQFPAAETRTDVDYAVSLRSL